MNLRKGPSAQLGDKAPTPAFMQIEGRIARPLPSEAIGGSYRRFRAIPPWVLVALVIAAMVALMIPGLLMELRRAF
jgi:hypothetical protein